MNKAKKFFMEKFNFPIAEGVSRRSIWRKKLLIDQWQHESPQEKIFRLKNSLVNVVEYAFQKVPYYKDLFRRIRFNPSKMKEDIRYFQEIPFLTKEIILSQPEQFLSSDFSSDEFIERKTSGSTGATFSFYYSKEDLDWSSAVVFYLNQIVSRDLSRREVHLIANETKSIVLFDIILERLKLFVVNRANVALTNYSSESSRHLLEILKSENPFLIYGLQSVLKAIIELSESPLEFRNICNCFVSSGETLDRWSADFIAEVIGCKVINRYGNAEFGAVAQSVDDPLSLKFVDGVVFPENMTICDFPEIVLTTLIGRAMPLLRYRTGDMGVVHAESDGSSTLKDIQGRLNDIVNIGGKKIHTSSFSAFLNKNFSIHDFQIVQKVDGLFEFRIITDYPEQLDHVKKKIESLTGCSINVLRIRSSELIRKGRQRKFAYYIKE